MAVAQIIGSERLCNDPIVDAYYYQDGHTEWDVPDRGEPCRRMQFVPFTPTNPEPTPTSEENTRGYITFVPTGRIGVLQEYRPASSERATGISIFAAPKEYELATLAIRPLRALGTVTFACGDLTGPGGATISASNIDTYILEPTAEPMNHCGEYMGDRIKWLAKWLRPGNSATTTAYKNVHVYLDVHVPDYQAPGIYTASVAIQPGGVTSSYFNITLEVMPFDLERSMSYGFFDYGWPNPPSEDAWDRYEMGEMWRNGLTHSTISAGSLQHRLFVNSSGALDNSFYDQYMEMYEETGFEDLPILALEAAMHDIFHALGVDNCAGNTGQYPFTDIYSPNFTADSVDPTTRAFAGLVLQNLYKHSIGDHTNCQATAYCKTNPVVWPAGTYFYFSDEPAHTDPWNSYMEKAKFMYGVARGYAPNMKTAETAYTLDSWNDLDQTLDLAITVWNWGVCNSASSNATWLSSAAGHGISRLHFLDWIAGYTGGNDPWTCRRLGFLAEKGSLDGQTHWTQWFDNGQINTRPFNPYIFATQTWKGGPWFMKDQSSNIWRGLHWLGNREAIDDSKYIRTLQALIDEADASGATTAANTARTALQQVLGEVPWTDPNDPKLPTWTQAKADSLRASLASAAKDVLNALSPVYVDKDAPGPTHNGQSWATAYLTLQEGINAATSGHRVWVASGTYVERITLKANVSVYGGFAGTETKKSQRNPRTNITILDGSAGGSVVTASSGVTATTVLDGFAIRNGSATRGAGIYCGSASPTISNNIITGNTTTGSPGTGGGIYCGGGSPKISNNVIVSNSAKYGGGIYCYGSAPVITNNTMSVNTGTTNGGGICSDSSSPTIASNIVVFGNSGVFGTGGAPVLRNNCVYGNTAYNYSGLSAGTGDISVDPLFVNAAGGDFHLQVISQCINAGYDSAVEAGGVDMDGETRLHGPHVDTGADEVQYALVIYVDKNAPGPTHDGQTWGTAYLNVQEALNAATLLNNEIWVASATYTELISLRNGIELYGGFDGTETARDQRDWNANPTILDGSAGGRVVSALTGVTDTAVIDGFVIQNGSSTRGGGIYCDGYSTPTIRNNLITGNSATGTPGAGGGIYCYQASPKVYNNVIVSNSANKYGGGIYCYTYSPTIVNNTIVSNTATTNGGAIYCDNSSVAIKNNIIAFNTRGIYKNGGAAPTLQNNCVYGNTSYDYSGLSAGTGDISSDPLFVDGPGGNYHIQAASPCIGAGDDGSVSTDWLDMDGGTRIFGSHVDIGADEAVYYVITGKVVLQDYAGVIAGLPVTIELRKHGGGTATMTANLDLDGNFSLLISEPGTYDVAIKASHWVQDVVPNVVVGP